MRLSWTDLGKPRADRANGKRVEITGFALGSRAWGGNAGFLMMGEPGCCQVCVPNNPLAVVEVLTRQPIEIANGALRLSGIWHVSLEAAGWRYQLREAEAVKGVTRRALMAASPLFCLPVPAMAQSTDGMAVDLHSHAGNLTRLSYGSGGSVPVAEPMRQGGVSVISLAVVSDSPTIKLTAGRLRPSRDPHPGELYAFSQRAFPALHALAREQGMAIVRTSAELRAAHSSRPSIIVASEGADFLEGRIERLDEAYQRWALRHLQLTHYRPNELGDIQTEPSVHDGLTAFGAEVVRRCNALGIVVDVAHATFEGVKKAAAVTTKPLVLSHTSLITRPAAWTRRILPDHAKAVAATGGVIGIWPVADYFPNVVAYARDGFARMVDVVGIDHVGLGTDQLGLVGASAMSSYTDLPQLASALRTKFNAEETAKLLGGNFRRVFEASVG
ncbi:MAG: peptidase M19 [Reyranella sp.]|uniref:dipeptidase n=1 Tax=Reyranella sp. TaxID=1929291 RepID=UPI0012028FB8|nr:membrane dipeptidase [Reyranella sp.]TAJ87823.1 MAG: peptidase M19 [Reyranella sp.]